MTELQPLVAERARGAELARRVDPDVWQAIRDSGVFLHFVPRCFGGLQLGAVEFVDVVLPIGEACASTAWVTSFLMEHNLILSLFPQEAQDEIFGAQPYILAPGAAFPPGTAVPVDGGYLVSGRWNYGSGIRQSDWSMSTARIEGTHDVRMVVVPVSEVEVHDVWHVDGLAATASDDITMDSVFVPEHRTLSLAAMGNGTSPGARTHAPDPTYAMPMTPFLAMTASLPLLGAARGALRLFQERVATRVSGGVPLLDRASMQVLLGEVMVQIHTAEVLVREAARDVVRLATEGRADDIAARAAIRARLSIAVAHCRDATRAMTDNGGSSTHALDDPLQRAARDIAVGSSHVVFDRLTTSELLGRVELGLPPQTFLICRPGWRRRQLMPSDWSQVTSPHFFAATARSSTLQRPSALMVSTIVHGWNMRTSLAHTKNTLPAIGQSAVDRYATNGEMFAGSLLSNSEPACCCVRSRSA